MNLKPHDQQIPGNSQLLLPRAIVPPKSPYKPTLHAGRNGRKRLSMRRLNLLLEVARKVLPSQKELLPVCFLDLGRCIGYNLGAHFRRGSVALGNRRRLPRAKFRILAHLVQVPEFVDTTTGNP